MPRTSDNRVLAFDKMTAWLEKNFNENKPWDEMVRVHPHRGRRPGQERRRSLLPGQRHAGQADRQCHAHVPRRAVAMRPVPQSPLHRLETERILGHGRVFHQGEDRGQSSASGGARRHGERPRRRQGSHDPSAHLGQTSAAEVSARRRAEDARRIVSSGAGPMDDQSQKPVLSVARWSIACGCSSSDADWSIRSMTCTTAIIPRIRNCWPILPISSRPMVST